MKPSKDLDGCALLSFLVLPLMAVGLLTFFAYLGAVSTHTSLWQAIPLGVLIGVVCLGGMLVASGFDMMDFVVSSIVLIVVTLFFAPPLLRARERNYKKAVQRALRAKATPAPPQKKAPQHAREALSIYLSSLSSLSS